MRHLLQNEQLCIIAIYYLKHILTRTGLNERKLKHFKFIELQIFYTTSTGHTDNKFSI